MPRWIQLLLVFLLIADVAVAGGNRCTVCGGTGRVYQAPTQWEHRPPTAMVLPGDPNFMRGYTDYVFVDQEGTWTGLDGGWMTCWHCNGTKTEPPRPTPPVLEPVDAINPSWIELDGYQVRVDLGGFAGTDALLITGPNGRKGLMSGDKRLLLAPDYDALAWEADMLWVQRDHLIGLLDRDLTLVHPPRFSNVVTDRPASKLLPAHFEGRWGMLARRTGRVVVKPTWDALGPMIGDRWTVMRDDEWGLVSSEDGSVVLPLAFEHLTRWGDGLVLAQQGGKLGVYTADGKQLLPPLFDRVGRNDRGFRVERDGKPGLYDAAGGELLPPEFDEVRAHMQLFVDGRRGMHDFYVVRQGSGWGLYNRAVGLTVPARYDSVTKGENFFVWVEGSEGRGAIATDGTVWVPPRFDAVTLGEAFVFDVALDGAHGIYENGDARITPRYLRTAGWSPTHQVAAVQSADGWGLVRPDGSWALESGDQPLLICKDVLYIMARPTPAGLTPPKRGVVGEPRPLAEVLSTASGEHGPPRGEVIGLPVPTGDTVQGLDVVTVGGRLGLQRGDTVVVPPRWDALAPASGGYVRASLDGQVGLLDAETGEVVLEPAWLSVGSPSGDGAAVKRETGWGAVNLVTGALVFEPTHDRVESANVAGHRLWKVKDGGDTTVYTATGDPLTGPHRSVRVSSTGLIVVGDARRKQGLLRLDEAGTSAQEVVPVEFDDLRQSSIGWLVRHGEAVGMLDPEGRWVLELGVWDTIEPAGSQTDLLVTKDGLHGVLNRYGETIVPPTWPGLEALISKGGKRDQHVWMTTDSRGRHGLLYFDGLELLRPRCETIVIEREGTTLGFCSTARKTFVVQTDGRLKPAR